MKECYGNYMEYPICEGHHDCEEKGCYSKTMIEKGSCDCSYKASCHLLRQKLQTELKPKYNSSIEDCDAYKMLKPMYEKKKLEAVATAL